MLTHSLRHPVNSEQIAEHTAHAKFVRDAVGLYLRVLDKLRRCPRTVTPEECKRLGYLEEKIGLKL